MAVYLGKDKVAGIGTSQSAENNNLKLPEVAPGVQQIVSINSDGTQQNLTLGEGVSIENGVLNASGGKLYEHNIFIVQDEGTLTIINRTSEIFTVETLKSYLTDNGHISAITPKAFNGAYSDYLTNLLYVDTGIYVENDSLKTRGKRFTLAITDGAVTLTSGTSFKTYEDIHTIFDTVVEL